MVGMMEGKVAVVTGAGGGIGREVAIMMAGAGAKVIVADIGGEVLADLAPVQDPVDPHGDRVLAAQRPPGRHVAQRSSGPSSVAAWSMASRIVRYTGQSRSAGSSFPVRWRSRRATVADGRASTTDIPRRRSASTVSPSSSAPVTSRKGTCCRSSTRQRWVPIRFTMFLRW